MPAVETFLTDLADISALHAGLVALGGEGLCLPVTAALARVLTEYGVTDVTAIAGDYNGYAHWWLTVGELIVDPTRGQFDPGPFIDRIDAEGSGGYAPEASYPPGWSAEHVVMEARRAFRFSDVGDEFGRSLLDLLRAAAQLSLRGAQP